MDRCYHMLEGVLFDILLYLPIMSLLRFKSVCKSWFSLIGSPAFISQHINYSNSKKEDTLITKCLEKNIPQLILLSGSHYEECVYIDFDQLHWHSANEVLLTGSCNGIICLEHYKSLDVALWNPALKQLRPLPLPFGSDSDRFRQAPSLGIKRSRVVTFGIDSKTNDYKVVSIVYFYKTSDESLRMLGNQVEIYNLRENSWRIIYEDDVLPFCKIVTSKAVWSSKNGKCFWIAKDSEYSKILLSFDFHDEVFGTMLFPYSDESVKFGSFCALDIYDDTLVYIDEIYLDIGMNFEIWILNEYGVNESWNKIYKIGPFYPDIIYPKGFSGNGEFLICLDDSLKWLCLYNLHTQETIVLQFCPHEFPTIHYNASLISIKSANGEG